MTTPRKFTFERSREQAEEILKLYEAGAKVGQLRDQFGLDTINIWSKIKQARKWRQRAEAVE